MGGKNKKSSTEPTKPAKSTESTATAVVRQQQQQQPTQRQQGILRVDTHQFRTSSPRLTPSKIEPSSPQPSVDRLSVTFAINERTSSCSEGQDEGTSPLPAVAHSASKFDFSQQSRRRLLGLDPALGGGKSGGMQRLANAPDAEEDGAEEDEYSVSASAIIQRRNSTRRHSRRKRRPSSPFSPDAESTLRRRSSAFTTSSGDTAISIAEAEGPTGIAVGNQVAGEEQISLNLKLHKEVLSGVKQQPWPLRKKLKLVRQAKAYVRKHEGQLQERLAQTRSTRDYMARASLLLAKKWQYFKRELINLKTVLVPWEHRIKLIESQFGSAVASYFIFLRWLFWFNCILAAVIVTFIALPELLATMQHASISGGRKEMLPEEREGSKDPLTLWEFEGYLKYSPFFYGWYANKHSISAYRLPLAYFVVNLAVYTYSFVAILRKMAENSRMSKLSEKEDECVFSWKLFSSWDFMIGNAETAQNRIGSIVLGLKEALLEESEKHRDARNWKTTGIRIMVNLFVFGMLLISAYAVVEVVDRSENVREANSSWWRQNEITVVLTLITYTFPMIFEILGMIESYHPRKQLRLQLGRIMILNLLNMYALIYALFKKINSSEEKLQSLKPKDTMNTMNCINKLVPCETNFYTASALAAMSLVLSTNTSMPKSQNSLNLWPNTYFSTDSSNYALSPDDESYNLSQENILLSGFDANDIMNVLAEAENNETSFTTIGNYNSSWDTSTESWSTSGSYESSESITSYEPPQMTSPAFDENAIIIEDSYPHVNYDDYGWSSEENDTESPPSSTISSSSPSPNTFPPPSNVKPIFPGVTSTVQPPLPTPSVSSCSDVQKVVKCYERVCENRSFISDNFSEPTTALDMETRRLLRGLCWETMFGQELAKLTVMDLVLTILSILGLDFFRALFVRYMNNCWCWDLEKQFPQYGDFKIAENILHLVNNQGMVWMGIFFSPGLIVLNVIKLIILMYLRSWTVLTCNVPHDVVFRASRSNNFYLTLLLTMLFLCVLPVGYAITWVEPSWHCGPFSGYKRIYHLATSSFKSVLPSYILDYRVLDYIASPGIIIPLIVLMALIIYYMVSLTNLLRESNNDLKLQLRKERTEERRKMFKIVEKRLESKDTPFARWDKFMPPKSMDVEDATAEENRDEPPQRSAPASESGELTEGEQESLPHDQPNQTSEYAIPRIRISDEAEHERPGSVCSESPGRTRPRDNHKTE